MNTNDEQLLQGGEEEVQVADASNIIMSTEEGCNGGGSEEVNSKQSMKKGPWTAAEDAVLIEYVNKYGEGNWNSVQRNSGLGRCGKSCRLRWANHLRPNLKKGAFSQQEEQIIIDLHAKLGNKWARMASQLPGRTDNEIKNFWNTRMKRRKRAGLPLYPQEVQEEASSSPLHHHHQHSAPPPPSPPNQPHPQPPSFSFSSLLSSCNYHPHNLNDSAYDIATTNNQYHQNMGSPLVSSVSPYRFNYGVDSHSHSSGLNLKLGILKTEISSTTLSSSYSSSNVHPLMGGRSNNGNYEIAVEGNNRTGLLDDVVVEGQGLSSSGGRRISLKRKTMEQDNNVEDTSVKNNNNNSESQRDDLSSSQSSTWKKPIGGDDENKEEDALEMEMNSMDDDLVSLLNNFGSEMPMPEWYRKGERQQQPLEDENREEANSSGAHTDQELAWTLGTCWNNMPSIC